MYLATSYEDILNEDVLLFDKATPSDKYRNALLQKYKSKLLINRNLNRSLISFQANKTEPFYRWFKFKEGFSTAFVKYILDSFGKPFGGQTILDPFSGIGTTMTTSIENGFNAIGIELLSPGILATKARIAAKKVDLNKLKEHINNLFNIDFENRNVPKQFYFQHLTITQGAFSNKTEIAIANACYYINTHCNDDDVRILLRFAISSILEDVSFTRKDGQYLRWDYRAGRMLKSKFDKGVIYSFKARLKEKLEIITTDIESFNKNILSSTYYKLIQGSCLNKLHEIGSSTIDMVITSPPYCNRYDYTRTYALELAFDGVDNKKIKTLRQTLLSATVENKSKIYELEKFYASINKTDTFKEVLASFYDQLALKEVIRNLYFHKDELNNKNIPNMVANYFLEMSFVIREISRVLKPGGKVIMVNDNVRYNGDEIPVDLILSEIAEASGLNTDVIWVLEKGKGNSSQQMGTHGRKELRKCIYVWSK